MMLILFKGYCRHNALRHDLDPEHGIHPLGFERCGPRTGLIAPCRSFHTDGPPFLGVSLYSSTLGNGSVLSIQQPRGDVLYDDPLEGINPVSRTGK